MPKSAGRRASPIAIVLAVSVLAGCAAQASPLVVSPTSSSIPAGPLVIVETRGGECPDGACGSTIVIEADGRVHATAPTAAELGSLPGVTLEGLATEISNTDFGALKSRPFTGTCPVAFDGQETVYTFVTASGAERIASCEVEVDPSEPVFIAVSAALAAVDR
jgi:hypothetical protein